MKSMNRLDASISGWYVNPSEIAICKHEDGSDWLLGTGSYGKVCCMTETPRGMLHAVWVC